MDGRATTTSISISGLIKASGERNPSQCEIDAINRLHNTERRNSKYPVADYSEKLIGFPSQIDQQKMRSMMEVIIHNMQNGLSDYQAKHPDKIDLILERHADIQKLKNFAEWTRLIHFNATELHRKEWKQSKDIESLRRQLAAEQEKNQELLKGL